MGRKKMSIIEITNIFYRNEKEPPLQPNNYIGSVIRRIAAKAEYYKCEWTIHTEGNGGRGGRIVWRAKKH